MIHVGTGFVKDPDITARALEIINEDLPRALIYEWLDTAEDVLVEVVREENNEKAEELLTAFIYGHRSEDRSLAGEDEDLLVQARICKLHFLTRYGCGNEGSFCVIHRKTDVGW